ncbi:MAG: glycosyltransferase family 2 protein [Bacteroides sp.]
MIHSFPLVSVIIPAYNSDKYLEACIQSVINQTYRNLEIILVNDGSTDGSRALIERYACMDTRIICINKQNEGLPLARKAGIDVAQGKYIQHLDSDDTLLEEALACLVDRAEHANADIVAAPFFFCNIGGAKKFSGTLSFDELSGIAYIKEILKLGAYWSVWSNFQKRSLFENNKIETVPHIYYGEDVILMIQLLVNHPKVVSLGKPILNYNKYPTSITGSITDDKYKNFRAYPVWIENFLERKGLTEELKKEIATLHLQNTFTCIHWKHLEDANKDMIRVVRDLNLYPDLKARLSNRERKIVAVYQLSRWLGYLNLIRYNKQGKI